MDRKKITFWIPALFIFFNISVTSAQKIALDTYDDNGKHIRQTSWELLSHNFKHKIYFRTSKIGDEYHFDLKMIVGVKGTEFAVKKGQKISFELINGETIEMSNVEDSEIFHDRGHGGFVFGHVEGVEVSYHISNKIHDELLLYTITKLKLDNSQGHYEWDIKSNAYRRITKALVLVE